MMRTPSRSWAPAAALLEITFLLIAAIPATAQPYPLPPWYFYGGGNGATWDGTSTSPDRAQLTVTLSPPTVPGQYGTAVAATSTDLPQITPLTTYILTLSAALSGSGSAQALMVDGTGVITNVSISGSTWRRYTNSFTTGSPDDPRVGRTLNLQLTLNRFGSLGTSTATFTNIEFQIFMPRPALSYSTPSPGVLQLLWSTNFYWYVPEQTADLQTGLWEDVTNPPVVQGSQLMTVVDVEAGQRYFRLRQP